MRWQSSPGLALAPLVILGVSAAIPCQIDDDCSLNGICDHQALTIDNHASCVCDPGWIGADCGALNVQPAKPSSGYNRTAEGISSWGSKIVHDAYDQNLYHLVLAEFINGCGLDFWSPYSRIVRAESRTGPQGPYIFEDQVIETFAHNPTVIWSEADKKYLLYYIGCSQAVDETCSSPSFTCGPGNHVNGESGISVASSVDLRQWTMHGQVFKGNNGTACDADVTNPSPFPLHGPRDQTEAMLLVYRGCAVDCESAEFINVAFSSSGFLGPYTQTSANRLFSNPNEDPFVWRNKRGQWHMLLHSLEADGGFGSGPKVGRHAFSRNWNGPWTFDEDVLAFNTTVDYQDGTSIDFYRRERPQLFFSEDGEVTPLYLTTGVQQHDSGQSYSVIVPIGEAGNSDAEGYRRDLS